MTWGDDHPNPKGVRKVKEAINKILTAVAALAIIATGYALYILAWGLSL